MPIDGPEESAALRLRIQIGGFMQARTLLKGTALALVGWFALAPVNMVRAGSPQPSFQVAQNEHYNGHLGPAWNNKKDHDEWYQGQRGRWYRGKDKEWQWRGDHGDQWYQGQQGHWYKENNGWQFGSDGLVCNNQGRDCRKSRYLPPNGQGMVNRKNPNLYWKCDGDGNHCNWARRPL
jgi:hypothetical protein